MFKSLKNKLKSWIKKEEEEIEETLDGKKELEEKPKEKKKKEKNVEKKGFFKKINLKINTTTLTQEKFDEIFNNVALSVVDKIKENLIEDLVGIPVKKGEIEKILNESLKDSISGVLKEPPNLIEEIKKKEGTYVIIIFGINGAGKTTSIAKLAHKLKKEKISCVLGAGDTFRAASIEQLEIHGEKLKIPVIKQDYNSDPAAVAFDTRKFAEKNKIKCAIIDTAGRMYTKENLIKQMAKIIRISQPDLKIFVGESITGNDATEQAKTFDESIGIDGIILTKADVDEKAGTILSVSHVTGKPIYFLGTGQNYQDLEDFKKEDILKKLDLDSEN
ncbi:signal recognition particle-docking protein FtsY [Candidatus Parvarchaeota archaeon]|nr:MAG: signal recognition particle-docking protein FtsY [Candidatus Parvarchaeota archaeon]